MQPLVKSESKKHDSPKTPGGISKALLTPIRRLGLSRNWKKNGPSPFRSPLSGANSVVNDNSPSSPKIKQGRRRQEPTAEKSEEASNVLEENDGSLDVDESVGTPVKTDEVIIETPTRSVSLPRKKKSKAEKLILSEKQCNTDPKKLDCSSSNTKNVSESVSDDVIEEYIDVSTPVRSKSRISRAKRNVKIKETPDIHSPVKEVHKVEVEIHKDTCNADTNSKENFASISTSRFPTVTGKTIIERSPNELTKECVVVIQKKIFKDEFKKIENDKNTQVIFDSDSDEPLCNVKDKSSKNKTIDTSEDDDFEEPKLKVRKLEDKNTSITGLKPKTKKKIIKTQMTQKPKQIDTNIQTSQGSLSLDDDDFDFSNKRTIVIRKSYEKVTKPHKAKSTGSISQKDIDELTARIEMKKKLLMAKAINNDTEELRELIKRWQKGCQDALMELMDLMKMKFPDKHNMDYSEILESLKIPATLVGYDSDNDCFVTPTDENVLMPRLDNL